MKEKRLRIAVAQCNLLVGDIDGNVEKILAWSKRARDEFKADLVVFPELSICGYPPEDLLFRRDFLRRCREGLERIRRELTGIDLVVGLPELDGSRVYNAAVVVRDGTIRLRYRKRELPNYGVFDEKRYFTPGVGIGLFVVKGIPLAISICEDAWHSGAVEENVRAGARLVINLNASPFHVGKGSEREAVIHARVAATGVPILYVNLVGGQDELVFDGDSFLMDQNGEVVFRLPAFEERLEVVEFAWDGEKVMPLPALRAPALEELPSIHRALVLGIRDYVEKNGFASVILGLSGGIDSSVVATLAVDALGPERVRAVMMPSRFTSTASLEDAEAVASNLGVDYTVVSIEPPFQAFLELLEPHFAGRPWDVTEENVQARIRGTMLMAFSNKFGHLVLSTGNKSEYSCGYATLYGDMAGGFAPIKDVLKTKVYRLAEYLNGQHPVIPERVLTKPPSAELRPGQKDEDALPPYAILDPILELYIEKDCGIEEIVAAGFDRKLVERVVHMVDRNEYKRRQGPPGIRVTRRAFGKDRRYPITNGFLALTRDGTGARPMDSQKRR